MSLKESRTANRILEALGGFFAAAQGEEHPIFLELVLVKKIMILLFLVKTEIYLGKAIEL